MNLVEFIKEYQSLVGSFLAVISSLFIVFINFYINRRKEIRGSKKEIEEIFLMAARESEDIVKDLEYFLFEARKKLQKREAGMLVFVPPKFNRIYLNEERLFGLKKNLGFILSQQVDIATSSGKKLNGYLNHFENGPGLIFDKAIKVLEVELMTKDKAIGVYIKDLENYLNGIEKILSGEIGIAQKHLLRPVVAQKHGECELDKMPLEILDKILDKETEIVLLDLKQKLS